MKENPCSTRYVPPWHQLRGLTVPTTPNRQSDTSNLLFVRASWSPRKASEPKTAQLPLHTPPTPEEPPHHCRRPCPVKPRPGHRHGGRLHLDFRPHHPFRQRPAAGPCRASLCLTAVFYSVSYTGFFIPMAFSALAPYIGFTALFLIGSLLAACCLINVIHGWRAHLPGPVR